MSRYALAFTLAVSFSMPMVMQADDHDKHDGDHQRRYYDQSHRDYHQWNDDEYWKWRHEHPDAHR